MKARPILFSGPMVRALLDGRKTQTRRSVKPQPAPCDHRQHNPGTLPEGPWKAHDGWHCATCGNGVRGAKHGFTGFPCPYGAPGDLLYVRETWRTEARFDDRSPSAVPPGETVWFDADAVEHPGQGKTRVSIHMPRWASRLTLEVTGVRIERLQDISEADAIAEGLIPTRAGWSIDGDSDEAFETAWDAYRELWMQINGPDSWDANPWVWVVEFTVHQTNVDTFIKARNAA